MPRYAVRATAVCLLLLAAVWAIPSYAISKEFNQSYPLQPGGTFELQNVNGPVDVQGWDRDVVEVHAVKTANHNEADLERVAIDVDARPDAISIATRYPQNEGVEVAVEYTIHFPHCARVEHIGTVNGTVRISGLDSAETTNGSLVLAVAPDLQADVEARCLNGNFSSELPITMESTQRPREMRGRLGRGGAPIHLRTVNGGIRLVVLRSSV